MSLSWDKSKARPEGYLSSSNSQETRSGWRPRSSVKTQVQWKASGLITCGNMIWVCRCPGREAILFFFIYFLCFFSSPASTISQLWSTLRTWFPILVFVYMTWDQRLQQACITTHQWMHILRLHAILLGTTKEVSLSTTASSRLRKSLPSGYSFSLK